MISFALKVGQHSDSLWNMRFLLFSEREFLFLPKMNKRVPPTPASAIFFAVTILISQGIAGSGSHFKTRRNQVFFYINIIKQFNENLLSPSLSENAQGSACCISACFWMHTALKCDFAVTNRLPWELNVFHLFFNFIAQAKNKNVTHPDLLFVAIVLICK